MLQGKYTLAPYFLFNPWIKSTPLGYGLISRYILKQVPQRNNTEEEEQK